MKKENYRDIRRRYSALPHPQTPEEWEAQHQAFLEEMEQLRIQNERKDMLSIVSCFTILILVIIAVVYQLLY